jgi:hypothetical protein
VTLDSVTEEEQECEPREPPRETDLRRLFESYDTVPALLFSQFEAIPDDQVLPPFAKDTFDFVYELRKLLSVYPDLHEWVQRRFRVPLPPRQPLFRAARSHAPFLGDATVAAASPVDPSDFLILATDGRLFAERKDLAASYAGLLPIPIRNGFAFYSSQQHFLLFYRRHAPPVTVHHICLPAVVLAADSHFALFLQSPSLLYKLALDDESKTLLYQLRTALLGVVVSTRFNIAVLLCEDKKARIRCLRNGKKVATFDCAPEAPLTALVTRGFGFVVCITATRIVLLTPNGTLIKWVRYDFGGVRQWFTFVSADGVDYIGFVRDCGEVWYFEAFYPEKIVRVEQWTDPVAVLYDCKHQAFRAVLRDSARVAVSHKLVGQAVGPGKRERRRSDGGEPVDHNLPRAGLNRSTNAVPRRGKK